MEQKQESQILSKKRRNKTILAEIKNNNVESIPTAIKNLMQDAQAHQNVPLKTNNLPSLNINFEKSDARVYKGSKPSSSSNLKLTPVTSKMFSKLNSTQTPILQQLSPSNINITSNSQVKFLNPNNPKQPTINVKKDILMKPGINFIVQCLNKTNGILNSVNTRLESMDKKFDLIEQNNNEIKSSMNTRFDGVDQRLANVEQDIKKLSVSLQEQQRAIICEMPACLPFQSVMDVKNLDDADDKLISNMIDYFEFIKGTTIKTAATNFITVSFDIYESDIVKNVYCSTSDYSRTDEKVNLRQHKFMKICIEAICRGVSKVKKPSFQEIFDSLAAALHARKEQLRRKTIDVTGSKNSKRSKADNNEQSTNEENLKFTEPGLQKAKRFKAYDNEQLLNKENLKITPKTAEYNEIETENKSMKERDHQEEESDEDGIFGEHQEDLDSENNYQNDGYIQEDSDANLIYKFNGQEININQLGFLNLEDMVDQDTPFCDKETYFEESQNF